jgi:hypothetical protein
MVYFWLNNIFSLKKSTVFANNLLPRIAGAADKGIVNKANRLVLLAHIGDNNTFVNLIQTQIDDRSRKAAPLGQRNAKRLRNFRPYHIPSYNRLTSHHDVDSNSSIACGDMSKFRLKSHPLF